MARWLFLLVFCALAGLVGPVAGAAPADELPARPAPFRFVTDQAHLLSEADANTLESGLRRYAANTGTQLVVVTVPTLGGRPVADYGRALGEAWGVGQRGKNNGVVVLLAGQEHQLTIQAGAGLRARITPAVTNRVISQQMTPAFKQGNYFAGLRAGLDALMLAANPASDLRQNSSATLPQTAGAAAAASSANEAPTRAVTPTEPTDTAPFSPAATTAAPAATESGAGLGIGALLLGGLLVVGVIWLLVWLFRRTTTVTTPAAGATPDFLPTRPGGTGSAAGQPAAPNFLPNNSTPGNSGGSGLGGILATGAAAAAGAYLGNRMADGHSSPSAPYPAAPAHLAPPSANPPDSGGGSEFPALAGAEAANEPAPDYFGPDNSPPDYFSAADSPFSDDASYDDTSSDNTGGGGFDDTSDNSGSW